MAASVATHETEQPLAEPKAQKTVMIVEDNELNMRLFRDLLSAFGSRPVETGSYTHPTLPTRVRGLSHDVSPSCQTKELA